MKPRPNETRWLYRLFTGSNAAVLHAIRRDIPALAECGARGPFYPRAAGEPRICRVCALIMKDFFPKEAKP